MLNGLMFFSLITLVQPVDGTPAIQAPPQVEIVVVRGGVPRRGEDRTAEVRFDAQTLKSASDVRVDEVLRQVPGVGLFRRTPSTTANATIQGISLRAIAPNGAGRALVTLNGVPQNDPFGGWIYWGRYDPAVLKSVSVKRGASGTGFGPLALTGALALEEQTQIDAVAHASTFFGQGVRLGFARGQNLDQGRLTLSLGHEESGGDYIVGASQRGLVDAPVGFSFSHATLSARIAQRGGDLVVRAGAFQEAKDAGLIGGESGAHGLDVSVSRILDTSKGQLTMLTFAQGRDFSNVAIAVNTQRSLATPSLNQYATPSSALGATIDFQPQDSLPAFGIEWRRAQGETREYFRYLGNDFTRSRRAGGQQDLIGIRLATQSNIAIGQTGFSVDGVLRLDHWSHSKAIRAETDRFTGQTLLSEAAPDQSGQLVSGRASLEGFGKGLRLSAYRTFRPPSLNELHRPFRLGNDVTEANSALEPETLVGLDLDWLFDGNAFGVNFRGQTTLFANRLHDPIANLTIGVGPATFPRIGFLPAGGSARVRANIGQVDAFGLESQIEWQRHDQKLSGFLALSITDAQVDGATQLPQLTGKRPAQAPQWSAAAGVRWRVSQRNNLAITLRGEGARFEDDLNTRNLSGFGALDVRFEHDVSDAANVFFAVDNALDHIIQTGRSGEGILTIAPRRAIKLGVTFTG